MKKRGRHTQSSITPTFPGSVLACVIEGGGGGVIGGLGNSERIHVNCRCCVVEFDGYFESYHSKLSR